MRLLSFMSLLIVCLWSIASTSSAFATVTQRVAQNSSNKESDLSPRDFIALVKNTELSTGDGHTVSSIDLSNFGRIEYLSFYLMYRAIQYSWFSPLLSDFGDHTQPCSPQQLSLQSYFKASIEKPAWCEKEQLEAARWLFDVLNKSDASESNTIKALFLLAHTAGPDLSPLEVMSAVTGKFSGIPPDHTVKPVQPPYLSKLPAGRQLTTFDGWDAWAGVPDASMLDANAILFWDQHLKGTAPIPMAIPDIRSPQAFFTNLAPTSKYFVGNELAFEGSFQLIFDPPPPPPPTKMPQGGFVVNDQPYAGAFIVANSIVLDRTLSGNKWGLLDEADMRQFPILSFSGLRSAGAVLIARNFVLGGTSRDLPQRVWDTIALASTQDVGGCGIGDRVFQFSTKGIDPNNLQLSQFYSARSTQDCFGRALRTWGRVLEYEISSKPINVLHRLIRVDLNGIRQAPYASTLLTDAPAFVGQKLLSDWNVAASERLLLQVRSAELQDDREGLGKALRDAEALRGRFLVQPTASSAQSLASTFAQISAVRDQKQGTRLLIRGSDYPEIPSLSAALLLGSATSKETWLIPSSLRVMPITPDPLNLRFARLWIDEKNAGPSQNVTLQLSALMSAARGSDLEVKLALERRGLQYSGQAGEVVFEGIRQSTSPDWSFDSISHVSGSGFLVTIRTSDNYFPVLKQQIGRPPGIPIEIDWHSTRDPKVSSATYGPIQTVIGLFGLPWNPLPIEAGKVRNPSRLPVDITSASTGDGPTRLVDPPIRIMPGATLPLDGLGLGTPTKLDTVIDYNGTVPVEDKISAVAPNWFVLPLKLFNMADTKNGKQVIELRLRLTILDGDGTIVDGPFEVRLGRFGQPEAAQAIQRLVPQGFRVRWDGEWLLADNSIISVVSSETESTEVRVN